MRNKLFYSVQIALIVVMFSILGLSITAHVAKAASKPYLPHIEKHITAQPVTPHYEGIGMITGINETDDGNYSITIQVYTGDKVYVLTGFPLKVARVAGQSLGATVTFGGDITTDTATIAFLTKSHFGH